MDGSQAKAAQRRAFLGRARIANGGACVFACLLQEKVDRILQDRKRSTEVKFNRSTILINTVLQAMNLGFSHIKLYTLVLALTYRESSNQVILANRITRLFATLL